MALQQTEQATIPVEMLNGEPVMSTNQRFDKSKLPSRHVTEGPARAPHRSYYYAMGMTDEEIHQPLVGVATCWNEAAPCNIALNRQAQAVKIGVKQEQGTHANLPRSPLPTASRWATKACDRPWPAVRQLPIR